MFGLKIGAAAYQMCTEVIAHALRKQGAWIMNYLDDYIGVATVDKAQSHYHALLNLLRHVGLRVNDKKLEPPGTRITCLGILIDVKAGVIAIPEHKMVEIKELC